MAKAPRKTIEIKLPKKTKRNLSAAAAVNQKATTFETAPKRKRTRDAQDREALKEFEA